MEKTKLRQFLSLLLLFVLTLVSHSKASAENDEKEANFRQKYNQATALLDVNLDSTRILVDQLLRTAIEDAPRSSKHAAILNFKGECYNRSGKPDSALLVFQEGLEIYEELGDTNRAIGNRLWMAMAYQQMEDFDAAVAQYKSSLVECSRIQDSLKIAIIFENMGTLYESMGDFSESLRCSQNALAMYELLKDSVYIGTSLGDIGELYGILGDPDKEISIKYQGLKVLQSQSDSIRLGLAYMNLSESIMLKDSLDKGLKMLQKAEISLKRTGYQFGLASVYSRYGFYYMDMLDDPVAAKPYCLKCIDLAAELGAVKLTIEAKHRLGKIVLLEGKVEEAIKYGQENLEMAREFGLTGHELRNEELLAEAYERLGRPAKALSHLNNYVVLKDSLYGESQKVDFARVEMQHAFDQASLKDSLRYLNRQKEIELASAATLATEKRGKLIAWFVLLLVAMAAAFVYRAYRSNKRQGEVLSNKNAALELALDEKAMLLKEVHHRVKNNFQVVSNLLDLQSRDIEDEKAKELAKEGKNRVRSMALIHQRLYQNDELMVHFKEYLEKLVGEIALLFGKENQIQTKIEAKDYAFDIDTAVPLGLIVNELATNSFKYGVAADQNGELAISLEKEGDGRYMLEVRDKGSGLPAGYDWTKSRSLGLRLVRRLAKQLMGEVEYIFDGGAVFTVRFRDAIARAEVD